MLNLQYRLHIISFFRISYYTYDLLDDRVDPATLVLTSVIAICSTPSPAPISLLAQLLLRICTHGNFKMISYKLREYQYL